jgi:hypothetical protein
LIKIEVDSVDVDIDLVVLLNETEDIRFVDVIVSFFEVVLLKSIFDVIC